MLENIDVNQVMKIMLAVVSIVAVVAPPVVAFVVRRLVFVRLDADSRLRFVEAVHLAWQLVEGFAKTTPETILDDKLAAGLAKLYYLLQRDMSEAEKTEAKQIFAALSAAHKSDRVALDLIKNSIQ